MLGMYSLNSSSGQLSKLTPFTVNVGGNPYYIAIDPSGRYLYNTNTTDATVTMFTLDKSTGQLTPMSPFTVNTGGGPQAIAISN